MSYNQIPIDTNGYVPVTTAADANTVDVLNSNSVPMLANASITNSWVNVLNYAQISALLFTDVPSASLGFKVQFSTDGANVDHVHSYSIAGGNVGENVQVPIHSKYYRTIYTNGNVNQSVFRMQTILHPAAPTGSIIEADDVISTGDDCLVTKSIITGQSVTNGAYVNAKMTPDGGLIVNQDIIVDPLNSSTANVAANAFFTGTSVTNITATAIQVFLNADQNCTVYVDQSQDGTNWDVSDTYNFYSAIGNFAPTVNAVGVYYRVRVKNIGALTTTHFRLQSILVPILSALPRSLSTEGWLQTAVNHVEDDNEFIQYNSVNGEQVSVPVYRLVGSPFNNNTLDSNFWTANVGTGGNVSVTSGQLNILTGTTANNISSATSVYTARYVAGQANKFRSNFHLDAGVANNTRRWGPYTATDGAFFELSGTTFSLVTRKGGLDTKVVSGAFDGKLGNTYILNTNAHIFEITYTPRAAFFFIDGVLIHSSKFNTSWTSTLDLPITIENFNTNGSTTNVGIYAQIAFITKYGIPQTQPVSKFQSGVTAGATYKIGTGSLHSVLISGVVNNANVTVYDSTTAGGTIIWSSGALPIPGGAVQTPFFIDFKGVTFNNGLTITVATAAAFVTTIYE